MYIRRKKDAKIFKVFGTQMDRQNMPAIGWSETVTWFLIWDEGVWKWQMGTDFVPEDERDEPSTLN